jgi:hypothetical protein
MMAPREMGGGMTSASGEPQINDGPVRHVKTRIDTTGPITVRPMPAKYPVWRKTYLWLISIAGAGTCIGVLAAALAPSPGNHYQPVGGILGGLGLLFSIWIGWCAHRVPLGAPDSAPVANSTGEGKPGSITAANEAVIRDSRDRLLARRKALAIVRDNPDLATELRIGRPDLPRSFDDAGLVDVNHVPASFLVELPGIDAPLAERIVAARDEVGGFVSISDLEITLELASMTISQVKEHLIFRPLASRQAPAAATSPSPVTVRAARR